MKTVENTHLPPSDIAAPGGRRASVLAGAHRAFLARGFDLTSMDAIAREAGVSKTTVYAHFGDKTALFLAVMEDSARSVDVDLDDIASDPTRSLLQKLTDLTIAVLTVTTTEESIALLRIVISETGRHPRLAEIPRRGSSYVVDTVIRVLGEHGYTGGTADAAAWAQLFVHAAIGAFYHGALLDRDVRPDAAALRRHAETISSLFVRGLDAPLAEGTVQS